MSDKEAKPTFVEIRFNVSDEPESSGFMEELRNLGFDQEKVVFELPKVTFKGQFSGPLSDLLKIIKRLNLQ
jgi:hypothetical protein